MSNPVMAICREGRSSDAFGDLERTLSVAGLHLQRPGDGAVFRLSEVGDEIRSTRDEVLQMARGERWLAVKFWLDEAVSAFVSSQQVTDGVCCETISIDTLDDAHKIEVSKGFVERFRQLEGRRLIVVDLFGQSFELVDWLSFFLNPAEALPREIPTAVSPTVLGLDRARFEAVADRFEDYTLLEWDGMVLASRPANLDDFPAWRWRRYQSVGTWFSLPRT
jgi:hypothetical protein